MNRLFLAFAGFYGATGIILGSLASHALNHRLSSQQIDIFKLGVQYQMYHALALLGIAVWMTYQRSRYLTISGWLFVVGTLFFSGTMYAITYLQLPNVGTAPIGGFAFIFGWLLLIVAAIKK